MQIKDRDDPRSTAADEGHGAGNCGAENYGAGTSSSRCAAGPGKNGVGRPSTQA